jgi:hypothetical protein
MTPNNSGWKMPKRLGSLSSILLLVLSMMPFAPLFAQSPATPPLTAQEFRYEMPDAGEVFLVWGVNGWNVVHDSTRPPRTVVKDKVMHTPMDRKGSAFVAVVRVPAGARIDYGFLITKTRTGVSISKIWEGNDRFYTVAGHGQPVEVKSSVTLGRDQADPNSAHARLVAQEFRYHMPEAGEVFLVWGVNGWAVVPEATRPAETVVKDAVMHTPMNRQGSLFLATIRAPEGAKIDYGFLITKTIDGTPIDKVWEGDRLQTVARRGGPVEVKSSVTLKQPRSRR